MQKVSPPAMASAAAEGKLLVLPHETAHLGCGDKDYFGGAREPGCVFCCDEGSPAGSRSTPPTPVQILSTAGATPEHRDHSSLPSSPWLSFSLSPQGFLPPVASGGCLLSLFGGRKCPQVFAAPVQE